MGIDDKTPQAWHVLDHTDAYRQEVQLFPNGTLVLQKVFTTPTGEEWDREGLTYLTPAAVAVLRALLGAPFRYAVGQQVRHRLFPGTRWDIVGRQWVEDGEKIICTYTLSPTGSEKVTRKDWAYETDVEPIAGEEEK